MHMELEIITYQNYGITLTNVSIAEWSYWTFPWLDPQRHQKFCFRKRYLEIDNSKTLKLGKFPIVTKTIDVYC